MAKKATSYMGLGMAVSGLLPFGRDSGLGRLRRHQLLSRMRHTNQIKREIMRNEIRFVSWLHVKILSLQLHIRFSRQANTGRHILCVFTTTSYFLSYYSYRDTHSPNKHLNSTTIHSSVFCQAVVDTLARIVCTELEFCVLFWIRFEAWYNPDTGHV